MPEPDYTPETLISVPNDLEAAMIVSNLAAHGVDATTFGEFTAGFRAEAPGEVKVLVRRSDLQRAREALDKLTIGACEDPSQQDSAETVTSGLGVKKLLTMAVVILLSIGILQSCL